MQKLTRCQYALSRVSDYKNNQACGKVRSRGHFIPQSRATKAVARPIYICPVERMSAYLRDYRNAFVARSVIHIQSGQNPMKRITLNVSEDVPVAT